MQYNGIIDDLREPRQTEMGDENCSWDVGPIFFYLELMSHWFLFCR